jgi:hypothetical protein
MIIQAVTSWEGTVAGLELLVEGSRSAAAIHEAMGGRNPRLWRASAGGDMEQAFYSLDFDSHEAYGKFTDTIMASDWWAGTISWMDENQEIITNLGTSIYYNAI